MAADKQKFVITGINRLTHEREIISGKHSEWRCREMLMKKQRQVYKMIRPAYTHLKMELAEREGELF